jgi:tetratricopeptide (TPR) repeat protein
MPTTVEALIAGIGHQQAGQMREAEAVFRQVLEVEPTSVYAWHLLGIVAHETCRYELAEQCLRQTLNLQADYADGYLELGWIFQVQAKLDEAIAHYQRALALNPRLARACTNLGNICRDRANLAEAIAWHRRGLEVEPESADILTNLGIALLCDGQHVEARAAFLRALEGQPNHPLAHNGLGALLKDQGRFADAAVHFARAVEMKPDLSDAHFNQARLWLLLGDFQRGWPEYEWRPHGAMRSTRSFAQSRWQGPPLVGKTILVHAEQGLGDTIQFIRYVPLLRHQGAKVVLEVQRPLIPLLHSVPLDGLLTMGQEPPSFDVYCPLLSLPGIFRTTLTTIPASIPYLSALPSLVKRWRVRINQFRGLKVGIAWQGNPQYSDDRDRSIPLMHFSPLTRVPDVTLINLQKGPGTEQLAPAGDQMSIIDWGTELDEASGPFMDTAAIMTHLDLVITSDTAIAHLAGALGVPVWVALSYVPDFRWLLDRSDSPWYPTMRLFRQKSRGDWAGVFREIEAALRNRPGAIEAPTGRSDRRP